MPQTQSDNLPNIKAWIVQNKWPVTAASVLLLLLLVVAVLPAIISSQFQKWVLANGADQVSVENVDFNPFTARLGLYNILIEKDGQQPFLLPSLEMHARWRDLFQRRFVVRSLGIDGVRLTVDQSLSEDSHVGGILLKRLVSDSAEPEPEPDDAKPWHFRIESLSMSDLIVDYRLQGLQAKLQVDRLSLSELDSLPDAAPAEINLNGNLDAAALAIAGRVNVFGASPGFVGKLTIDQLPLAAYLPLVDAAFAGNTATIAVDSQLQLAMTADGLSLEQDGQAGLSDLSWQLPGQLLETKSLQWRGTLNLQQAQDGGMQLLADGNLDTAELLLNGAEQPLTVQNQRLVWQGRVETSLGADQRIISKLDGQLHNIGLDLDLAATDNNSVLLKNTDLNWQGKASVDISNDTVAVDAEGKLQNEGMLVELERQQLHLETEAMAWQGDLAMRQTPGPLELSSSGNARINGLLAQTLDKTQRVLRATEIAADNLELTAVDSVAIKRLSFNELSLGNAVEDQDLPSGLAGFVNYDQLLFEPISFDGKGGLAIGSIHQEGAKQVFVRNEDGSWGFATLVGAFRQIAGQERFIPPPDALRDDQDADRDAEKNAVGNDEAEDALPVRVDRITISPGSKLFYQDKSLSRPFVKKIDIQGASVGQFDSSQPELSSPLSLKANINNAQIVFDGDVTVFAEQPTFDINGEIQAMSLLPYSQFMEKAFGYRVDSGSLNATSTLVGKDGKLESNTELILNQLDIEQLSEAELKAIDAKLNAGLETGLSMLKDKNDTIKLKVPVNGEFADLEVDPSDIINQAMGKALKKGAKTYFAAALFPFGTLLVVADAAAGSAMKVKLDPVFFAAGGSELGDGFHPYLEKVANILDEKPEIFVKVCGVSAQADREQVVAKMKAAFLASQPTPAKPATSAKPSETEAKADGETAEKPAEPEFVADEQLVEQQLKALAVTRAGNVTDFLLKDQDVEPKRLIGCQPRIDSENADARPRADLLL